MYAIAPKALALSLAMMLVGAIGNPLQAQDPPLPPEPEREQDREREEMQEFQQRMELMIQRMKAIRDQAQRVDLEMGERLVERRLMEGDVDAPERPVDPEARPEERPMADEAAVMLDHERIRRLARTMGRTAENVLDAMEQAREMQRDRAVRRAMEARDGHQSLAHLWAQLEELGRAVDQNMGAGLRILEGMGETLQDPEATRDPADDEGN